MPGILNSRFRRRIDSSSNWKEISDWVKPKKLRSSSLFISKSAWDLDSSWKLCLLRSRHPFRLRVMMSNWLLSKRPSGTKSLSCKEKGRITASWMTISWEFKVIRLTNLKRRAAIWRKRARDCLIWRSLTSDRPSSSSHATEKTNNSLMKSRLSRQDLSKEKRFISKTRTLWPRIATNLLTLTG